MCAKCAQSGADDCVFTHRQSIVYGSRICTSDPENKGDEVMGMGITGNGNYR